MKTDRSFFFASYSGLRQEETYYRNTAVVPTDARAGRQLLAIGAKAQRPADGCRDFRGISSRNSRFDVAAKEIQAEYIPPSNLPNSFFEIRRPDPLDTDEATVKLDHNLSAGRSMAVSYFYQTGTDTQPLSLTGNIPWVDRDFKWNQHNLNIRRQLGGLAECHQPVPRLVHASVRRPGE